MTIRTDRDALIIVDQQLDYQPGGALAIPEGDTIVDAINALAVQFIEIVVTQEHHPQGHVSFASSYVGRRPGSVVTLAEAEAGDVELSTTAAFTIDELCRYLAEARDGCQRLWPDHCIVETPGWNLDPRLELRRASLILRKGYRPAADSYSAFRENDGVSTGLAEMLMAKGIERVAVVGPAGDGCVLNTAIDAADSGLEVVYLEDLTRLRENSRQATIQSLEQWGVNRIESNSINTSVSSAE